MHNYLISGLRVSSELELPGAIPETVNERPFDVSVRRGALPPTLVGVTDRGPTWELAGEKVLMTVPHLARFGITAGRDIAVEVEHGVLERDVAGVVLGTAFGILLHQRGALVLHGAAVAKDGRAIAICGSTGAGKSTLAAALYKDGWSIISDDICVVGLDDDRRPVVLPDGKHLKLWNDSIARLDLTGCKGEAVRTKFEKYYVNLPDAHGQPSPLSAIYVLRDWRPSLKNGIESLTSVDAMRMLDYEAYRPVLRAKMGQKQKLLADAAALFGHAKIFLFVRPRGFEHLKDTVTTLRAHQDLFAR